MAPRGKGQVRAGLRYVRSVPDLWVPLVMMAVVGSLAFNFQVVFPLFVTRPGRDRRPSRSSSPSLSVGSLIGALWSARARSSACARRAGRRSPPGVDAAPAVTPCRALAFPGRWPRCSGCRASRS